MTARAFTPLLDQPLEGPVYFRSNGGERELPDIVADLKGQFRIILVGFIDSRNARIRTRFQSVPDAPVSKFTLNLKGEKGGLLVNNRNLCGGKQRAKLSLKGQNGRRYVTQPMVQTRCKKGKRREGRRALEPRIELSETYLAPNNALANRHARNFVARGFAGVCAQARLCLDLLRPKTVNSLDCLGLS